MVPARMLFFHSTFPSAIEMPAAMPHRSDTKTLSPSMAAMPCEPEPQSKCPASPPSISAVQSGRPPLSASKQKNSIHESVTTADHKTVSLDGWHGPGVSAGTEPANLPDLLSPPLQSLRIPPGDFQIAGGAARAGPIRGGSRTGCRLAAGKNRHDRRRRRLAPVSILATHIAWSSRPTLTPPGPNGVPLAPYNSPFRCRATGIGFQVAAYPTAGTRRRRQFAPFRHLARTTGVNSPRPC